MERMINFNKNKVKVRNISNNFVITKAKNKSKVKKRKKTENKD